MTNKELAQSIVHYLGGEQNIASLTNCITRLRITLYSHDTDQKNLEAIKDLDGVLSVLDGDTIQIVLGPGKVTKIANEIHENTSVDVGVDSSGGENDADIASDTKQAYKAKQTSLIQQMFRHLGNIFVPIIPGLVASGLLLGIANIITNMADPGVGLLNPDIAEASWFQLLEGVGNLLFGSLGVFVGINTAREFGGTMVLGGIAGLLIYAPVLDDIGALNLFGLDLKVSEGLGGLLGAIFAAYVFTKIERFTRKHTIDSLDLIVTPLVTLLLGAIVTFIVIQPVAGLVMDGITWFLVDLMLKTGCVIGGFVLSATFLPLVTVGMHQGLIPVHLELIDQFGSTTLLPILSMAGGGQVGAAIAILIKTKNKRMKNTVTGALPVGILGVGEPLIYGVSLPLGRPFLTACLGAGFGGAFLSLFSGVGAISVGPSGLALIPLIANNKYLIYIISLVISYLGGFILTYLFGYKERMATAVFGESTHAVEETTQPDTKATTNTTLTDAKTTIYSPLKRKIIPLHQLSDEVFASEAVGKGLAIQPEEGKLYAPANGIVTTVFPTGHAIGITSDNGEEILLHIGLDTVDIRDNVFEVHIKKDEEVKKGDLLCSFNIEAIVKKGYDISSPIIITNSDSYTQINPVDASEIKVGDTLLTLD